MQAYSEYKDSSFEFLGKIPSKWNVKRAKYVYSEVKEPSEDGSELLLSVSEYYGVKPRNQVMGDGEFVTRADSLEGYKKCQSGDLVMNIMLAWKTGLGVSDFDGIVSPSYAVFRPITNVHSKYLHYLLRTNSYVSEFKRNSTGIIDSRLRLYPDDFLRIPILLPSLPEQQAIASFLECKTAQIDTLIEKKQQQIVLLQEQRTALINHAVTKGLNFNTSMKDSDVDWLGEIPIHWETWRLQHLCSTTKGIAFKSDIFTDEGVFVVKATNIKNESIVNVNTFMSIDDAKNHTSVELREGDIILSTVGSKPHIVDSAVGQIARIPTKYHGALLNQNTVRIENKRIDLVTTDFLFLALRSHRFRKHLGLHAHGTANQASINLEDILSFFVTLPPVEEQLEIVSESDNRFKSIEKSVADFQKEIDLLNEYRTALISEAVTGKIDVREYSKQ